MSHSLRSQNYLSWIAATLLTLVGCALFYGILKEVLPSQIAEISLKIRLRGRNDRPVQGAEIWVTRPSEKLIGITNRDGHAHVQTILPKGKLAVIEARGRQFRVAKELLVPNISHYETWLSMDLKEAKLGLLQVDSAHQQAKSEKEKDQYEKTLSHLKKRESQEMRGKVIVSISENQPTLSTRARGRLAQIRQRAIQAAQKTLYEIQAADISNIELRLLKAQSELLEIRLLANDGTEHGSTLLNAEKTLATDLSLAFRRARERGAKNRKILESGIAFQDKDVFWTIRKRPVDDLTAYLNGLPLPTRSSHHALLAALPVSYQPRDVWHLAVTGKSGLVVDKRVSPSRLPRPVRWAWPEWNLSQSR